MMNHTPISALNTSGNKFKQDSNEKPNYYLVNKYPEFSIIKDDVKIPE